MSTQALEILSAVEQAELRDHEAIIARGLDTFVAVGRALAAIRDGRLYRASHATFEAYCRERWEIGRAHAYRLMDGAQIVDTLSPTGDTLALPERQVRELVPLRHDVDGMVAALERARVLACDDAVTAVHIRQAVTEFASPAPAAPPQFEEVPSSLASARRWLEAALGEWGIPPERIDDDFVREWAVNRALQVAARQLMRGMPLDFPPPYHVESWERSPSDSPKQARQGAALRALKPGPAAERARLAAWELRAQWHAGRFLRWCEAAGIVRKGRRLIFPERLTYPKPDDWPEDYPGEWPPAHWTADQIHDAAYGAYLLWWLTPEELHAMAEEAAPA